MPIGSYRWPGLGNPKCYNRDFNVGTCKLDLYILVQSKLKAFADGKLKVIQKKKFILDKIENIVGKEENAGYQQGHWKFEVKDGVVNNLEKDSFRKHC